MSLNLQACYSCDHVRLFPKEGEPVSVNIVNANIGPKSLRHLQTHPCVGPERIHSRHQDDFDGYGNMLGDQPVPNMAGMMGGAMAELFGNIIGQGGQGPPGAGGGFVHPDNYDQYDENGEHEDVHGVQQMMMAMLQQALPCIQDFGFRVHLSGRALSCRDSHQRQHMLLVDSESEDANGIIRLRYKNAKMVLMPSAMVSNLLVVLPSLQQFSASYTYCRDQYHATDIHVKPNLAILDCTSLSETFSNLKGFTCYLDNTDMHLEGLPSSCYVVTKSCAAC